MRLLLFLVFTISIIFGYSQKKAKYTLYKMGRPQSFERNNATRDAAKKWRIEFVALSGSGVYSERLDSLIIENKKTELVLQIKWGNEWRTQFDKDVNERFKQHNEIRTWILSDEFSLPPLTNEPMIEVTIKNKRKAKVIIFIREKVKDKNVYMSVYQYKINVKTKRNKLLSNTKEPIKFSYPENGIEN